MKHEQLRALALAKTQREVDDWDFNTGKAPQPRLSRDHLVDAILAVLTPEQREQIAKLLEAP